MYGASHFSGVVETLETKTAAKPYGPPRVYVLDPRPRRVGLFRFWSIMARVGYGYGFFPGGDPRKFFPDEESCTAEELRAHREACAAWDRGEQDDVGPACVHSPGVIVTRSLFGLGGYKYVEEEPPYDYATTYRKRLPRRRKKATKSVGLTPLRAYWESLDTKAEA